LCGQTRRAQQDQGPRGRLGNWLSRREQVERNLVQQRLQFAIVQLEREGIGREARKLIRGEVDQKLECGSRHKPLAV
jgi:hypothetical protein